MKSFLLYHFLPIVILVCILAAWQKCHIPDNLLSPTQKYYRSLSYPVKKSGYYKKLDSLGANSDLIYALSNKSLVLFGSSEFENPSAAQPQNFIPQNTNCSVLTIGSAGFQSFCVYNQLAAASNLLDSARIVIFISPFWYSNTWENGAGLQPFLDNNNLFVSSSIINNPILEEKYKKYVYDYIYRFFIRIYSPTMELQEMDYLGESPKGTMAGLNNFRNSIALSSVKKLALYLRLQSEYLALNNDTIRQVLQVPFRKHQIADNFTYAINKPINWDSLNKDAAITAALRATNNSMGMLNDKYEALMHNPDSIQLRSPADADTCREFKDLKMLLSLLKDHKANASFVIVPVNPFFLKKISRWKMLTQTLETEIRKYDFDCYNPFTADTALYKKGTLRDEQHFGDLGWYKVNRFIMEKYF